MTTEAFGDCRWHVRAHVASVTTQKIAELTTPASRVLGMAAVLRAAGTVQNPFDRGFEYPVRESVVADCAGEN